MTIVCLGWGSLIWDPRDLPIAGDWAQDGPELPLEFARESTDGRMTLVIVASEAFVPTLWVPLRVETLDEAVDALAIREGVQWRGSIGRWPAGPYQHRFVEVIGEWALERNLAGVVWTDLKSGFRERRGSVPSLEEVTAHLAALPAKKRADAARYISSAPLQIQTPYRAALERLFR